MPRFSLGLHGYLHGLLRILEDILGTLQKIRSLRELGRSSSSALMAACQDSHRSDVSFRCAERPMRHACTRNCGANLQLCFRSFEEVKAITGGRDVGLGLKFQAMQVCQESTIPVKLVFCRLIRGSTHMKQREHETQLDLAQRWPGNLTFTAAGPWMNCDAGHGWHDSRPTQTPTKGWMLWLSHSVTLLAARRAISSATAASNWPGDVA